MCGLCLAVGDVAGDVIQSLLSFKPTLIVLCGLCSALGDVAGDAIQSLLSSKPSFILMCGLCSAAGDVARGRCHPGRGERATAQQHLQSKTHSGQVETTLI